ncbi:MAG: hypothetical protein FWB74_06610 [Defluviitaleaceae bacterium]|nr:hypothetical protein [Defluviitaleaceae bacterium]
MDEPVLSERFDVEDIRKLRIYQSKRRINMTFEELKADIEKGANEFMASIEEIRRKKQMEESV